MRLMVLFDLPVTTKKNRLHYSRFHTFLKKDGYDMLQYSIYARICNGQDSVNKHLLKLKANLPPEGSVRCMQVTEKQYANIAILVGNKTEKEKSIYTKQLSIF